MTGPEPETERTLRRLVVIGIAIACLSWLLALPAVFKMPHSPEVPVSATIGFMSAMMFLGIWFLWQIQKHKNWARRLYIAFFFVGLANIPQLFFPATYQGYSFPWAARFLGFGSLIFNGFLTFYLFKPNVRSLFTAAPANKKAQIIYAVLAIGIGFIFTKKGSSLTALSDELATAQTTNPKLYAAERVSRIKLPDWRQIGEAQRIRASVRESESEAKATLRNVFAYLMSDFVGESAYSQFGVVPFRDPNTNLNIVLFFPDRGVEGKLETMLLAIDKDITERKHLTTWSRKTVPNLGKWADLSPQSIQEKTLPIASNSLSVQEVRLRNMANYQGRVVYLRKDSWPITVLAFQRGSFDESGFKTFLNAFLAIGVSQSR